MSALALWGIARRLFGQDREAAVVALVLLCFPGEVLLGGMSLFAMPAHLACTLVWLWLFLRDERRADLAALALGFLATGLHQPLFHPMAVAPWLALLVWQRRWGRLALFVPVYGVIGLFWLWWPHITLAQVMGPGSSINDAGAGYLSRLLDTLRQNNHTPN
jgi:4-amino-4-deoxy-L-arabinose transferase-like glycosyltransferase